MMKHRLTYFILAWPFFTLISAQCEKCLHKKCNTDGVCTSGCLAGYTGNKCQYQCQSSCKDSRCQEQKTTGKIICSKGCEDGYCGVQCKTPCDHGCLKCDPDSCNNCTRCRGGVYGDHCQYRCYEKCSGYACDNEGVCLSSCANGRYGTDCSHECSPSCASCDEVTGNCFKCRKEYFGDSCEHQCPTCLTIEDSQVYLSQAGCVRCTAGVMRKDSTSAENPDNDESKFLIITIHLTIALFVCVMSAAIMGVIIIRRNKFSRKRRRCEEKMEYRQREDSTVIAWPVRNMEAVTKELTQELRGNEDEEWYDTYSSNFTTMHETKRKETFALYALET